MAIRTPEREQRDAHVIGLMEKLSDKWRISVEDIARIANAIAQSEIDPLYTIHHQPLFVPPRKPKQIDAKYEHDFQYLSIPPDPFEHCTLLSALSQYEQDSKHGYELLKKGDPADDQRVIGNQLGWARFLAVRHPHPIMRQWFEGYIEALKTGTVTQWTLGFIEMCETLGIEIEIGGGTIVSLRKAQ